MSRKAIARVLHGVFEDEALLKRMAVGFAREMTEDTARPSGPDASALDKKIRRPGYKCHPRGQWWRGPPRSSTSLASATDRSTGRVRRPW